MKVQQKTWKKIFLPKDAPRQFTWQMIFLLCVSVFVLVDSFFIPLGQKSDPGGSGEGMLFMVLGYRAVNRRGLSTPVMLVGTLLAALISGVNHGLPTAPDRIRIPLEILLGMLLMFCGYTREYIEQPPKSGEPDTQSTLHLSPKS